MRGQSNQNNLLIKFIMHDKTLVLFLLLSSILMIISIPSMSSESYCMLINHDHCFIPIRNVSTMLGITITYNIKTKYAYMKLDKNYIYFRAFDPQIFINGKLHNLTIPPIIYMDTYYFPATIFNDVFGCHIYWNNVHSLYAIYVVNKLHELEKLKISKSIQFQWIHHYLDYCGILSIQDFGTGNDSSFDHSPIIWIIRNMQIIWRNTLEGNRTGPILINNYFGYEHPIIFFSEIFLSAHLAGARIYAIQYHHGQVTQLIDDPIYITGENGSGGLYYKYDKTYHSIKLIEYSTNDLSNNWIYRPKSIIDLSFYRLYHNKFIKYKKVTSNHKYIIP